MAEEIILYGFGDSDRSGKVRWLANELGLEVKDERIEFMHHVKPPYTEMNPLAQVPTVVFRGKTLIESTAICHIMAEAFDEPKLWKGRGDPGREEYLFWLAAFGENVEGRLVESYVAKLGILPKEHYDMHERALRFKLKVLASRLPAEGFLCGEDFTIADILAGYSLRLGIGNGLLDRERCEPYFSRLVARPAAKAARFFDSLDAG